jgi:hypothetical protein
MGLFAELIAETGSAPAANPAKPANIPNSHGQDSQIRKIRKADDAGPGKVAESQMSKPDTAELRAHLIALAAVTGREAGLVQALPESFLRDCQGLPDETLRALLGTLADDAERRAGRVPHRDTAAVLCRRCGPVWLHPSIADAAPKVHGWPVVLGCPWCFVPKDGALAIPRPPVTCGTCQHFTRDTINPEGGAGTCTAGINPALPWPNAQQCCAAYSPKAEQ